ncbi:MAG: peptidoglycan editing factor PgeF [Acidobacteriota bacterium]
MDHFRIRTHDTVKVIECVPLAEAGFINGFSTRLGGVSPFPAGALNLGYFSGDKPENVGENRRRFLSALELDQHKPLYHIVTAKQIHSAESHIVIEPEQTEHARVSCDALLTDQPYVLLGIQTADCLPVLIVDPVRRAIAGIHAGWRGTLARIVERTLDRMQESFGSNATHCLAALGPAIGPCCFEVGPDVHKPFAAEFAYVERLFSRHQPNGKAYLDLPAANREQLLNAGLASDNIFIWQDCTRCHMENYFSYRGENHGGAVGRLLAVVGLA